MPSRKFDTYLWKEPWFQEYTANEKLLYIFLSRNNDCSACGIYTITVKTIGQELDLPTSQVDKALRGLEPRVLYDRRISLIFFRHFVEEQRTSDLWLKSVEKALNTLKPHMFIKEFMQINKRFSIGYQYPIDMVSIAPDTDTDSSLGLFLKEGGLGGDSQPETPQETQDPLMARFLRFWEAYPNKKSKGQAETTWEKVKPSEQLLEEMLKTLEQARTSEEWTDQEGSYRKKFIPHPSSWLNAKGWEDEYTPREKGGVHEGPGSQRIKEPGYDN